MIEFLKVTKKFGKRIILDDITFNMKKGEFVVLTGPSGAGKTTLINALIGAEKIKKGKILIDGFDVTTANSNSLQNYRRHIGIVFQDYKLLPKKTVFENIAFALEVCGYKKKIIDQKVVEAMRITGVEELRNSYPSHLSGGEKQRTSVARAIVHSPKLLIADEPTGNLDEENTKKIIQLLQRINQSGTTVILATHDKSVMDMVDGRLIKLFKTKII